MRSIKITSLIFNQDDAPKNHTNGINEVIMIINKGFKFQK